MQKNRKVRERIKELRETIKTQEEQVQMKWRLAESVCTAIYPKMFEDWAIAASSRLRDLKAELAQLKGQVGGQ
jgi:cell division septum initiation protein DivIVA